MSASEPSEAHGEMNQNDQIKSIRADLITDQLLLYVSRPDPLKLCALMLCGH